jgi:3-carboxy-cis,cis-muconate cycloisomerase
MSSLFDPLFGMTAVDAATDDRSWLAAMCEAETALARACSQAELIDLPTALEIGAAADKLKSLDPAELGRDAVDDGNPVIPLVLRLREAVAARADEQTAAAVHLGATSQDILDTAAMLVTARALGVIYGDLRDCADHTAAMARAHRDTVMIGRTLLQQALPTTFGAVAAGWGTALDRALRRVAAVRDALPVQLGGPTGTLAGWYPHGFKVRAAFAAELELRDPSSVWHTDRGVIVDVAATLGAIAATIGKISTDVVLLAQSELAEVRERRPGGSSSMPHKRNPIAAVTARAAAAQMPGLVATLLATATPELQRGAGPWHAEWLALTAALRSVGGAASRLRECVVNLEVDAGAMRGHVDATTPDVGHARDLVDRYLDRRRA